MKAKGKEFQGTEWQGEWGYGGDECSLPSFLCLNPVQMVASGTYPARNKLQVISIHLKCA
jgi:hypothetical protein